VPAHLHPDPDSDVGHYESYYYDSDDSDRRSLNSDDLQVLGTYNIEERGIRILNSAGVDVGLAPWQQEMAHERHDLQDAMIAAIAETRAEMGSDDSSQAWQEAIPDLELRPDVGAGAGAGAGAGEQRNGTQDDAEQRARVMHQSINDSHDGDSLRTQVSSLPACLSQYLSYMSILAVSPWVFGWQLPDKDCLPNTTHADKCQPSTPSSPTFDTRGTTWLHHRE
jgi:hypothetical protein